MNAPIASLPIKITEAIQHNILALTRALMQLQTDPGATKPLNKALDLIREALERCGFTPEYFESEGVRSVLFYKGKTRPARFTLILNGHLDVIPGKSENYRAHVVEDKLYGVGSMDMKANVAAMVAAFKTMAHQSECPIGLQIVTDEEIGGHHGTGYQVNHQGVKAEFVIAGESTGFNIANQARGVLQCQLVAKGTSAHGAYPWRGNNAVISVMRALESLQKLFPNPHDNAWQTTLNIANISTPNESYNKVPDLATAKLDIRFTPEEYDQLRPRIKSVLPPNVTLDITADEPALYTPIDNIFVQHLIATTESTISRRPKCYGAMGTSDARFYQGDSGTGIEFGPIGGGIGSDEEWVSIQSLYDFYEILCNFIVTLNARQGLEVITD